MEQKRYIICLKTLDHDVCPHCGIEKNPVFESRKNKDAKVSLYECGSTTDFRIGARLPYLVISKACDVIRQLKGLP